MRVRYRRPRGTESRLLEQAVAAGVGGASTDLTFAAAVGMLLRDSEHRGSITVGQVVALAKDGLGADEDGDRKGFLDLVRAYEALAERTEHRR